MYIRCEWFGFVNAQKPLKESLPLLTDRKWFVLNILRKNLRIEIKFYTLIDIDNIFLGILLAFYVN